MVLYLAPYIAHNRCPINNSEIIERNVSANYGQKHNGKWYALQKLNVVTCLSEQVVDPLF